MGKILKKVAKSNPRIANISILNLRQSKDLGCSGSQGDQITLEILESNFKNNLKETHDATQYILPLDYTCDTIITKQCKYEVLL